MIEKLEENESLKESFRSKFMPIIIVILTGSIPALLGYKWYEDSLNCGIFGLVSFAFIVAWIVIYYLRVDKKRKSRINSANKTQSFES